MYRVTLTSLVVVSLLLVFVHSIQDPGEEDGPTVDGDVNKPPNRLSASTAIKTNSQIRVKNTLIHKRPPKTNTGGAGGVGSVQNQLGDGSKSKISGANGGAGGSVIATGSQNTGGAGGSGTVQHQGGANSEVDISGGNGAAGGSVLGPQPSVPSSQSTTNIENTVSADKRDFTASSSINSGSSFPGQNVGGRGGDGHVQVQGGSNAVSGGNGGAGGSVFARQPSIPFRQSSTNIESRISANKRDFTASSSINSGPLFPGQNVGGRGGDGSVQAQGDSNSVSGGNGGAGGSVFGSQPSIPFRQSTTNIENTISANKRDWTASSSINSGPLFPGQNVGGRGGDGSVQAQGSFNSVSGGNGGAGGSVFGSEPGFQSNTNIENSVSANKRELGSGKNVSRVD